MAPLRGRISCSPATIAGTKLIHPSDASGRLAPTASIQRTSNPHSGYYCRIAHGPPISDRSAVSNELQPVPSGHPTIAGGLFLCLGCKETATACGPPRWLFAQPIVPLVNGTLPGKSRLATPLRVRSVIGRCFKAAEFAPLFPLKRHSLILANKIVDKIVDISANNFKSSVVSLMRSRDRGPTGSAR